MSDEIELELSEISPIELQVEESANALELQDAENFQATVALSDEAKQALLQIASKVAYIDDQGATYYQALYDALYNTTWTVTNTLSHCVTSNAADSVTKGDPYSATITPATGYKLAGAAVVVTMGGVNITSTAYNNGVISIAAVTGNLVISVTAAAVEVASISAVYTQSGTVYDTASLDSLKDDLVVTATYDDTSTATVPSTDYTLSGTLTAGTSTITVSYSGKTDAFSATITHGFHYTASDGKLSEQSYVTYTNTTSSLTETLTNDGTRIYSPKVSSQVGNCKWEFLDYNLGSANCEMTVQFKIVSLGFYSGTNSANIGYFLAAIYNGETGGGTAGFARYDKSSGAIEIRTAVGDTVSWGADVSVNVWHEVKITVNNGLQTVTLDGATIISNQNPSTRINYGANTMIRAGESSSGINDVYIRRIEFKEVS